MSKNSYPWYLKFTVLIISLLVSLTLCELALRLIKPPNRYMGAHLLFHEKNHNVRFDSYLGWTNRENINDHDENGFRINNNGSLQFSSPATILAIGDSYTYGDEVKSIDSWPSNLERQLNLRVVNAGVGGFGLAQMFVRTENVMSSTKPKTVVVASVSDDLLRTKLRVRHGYNQPYFRLNQSGAIVLVEALDNSGERDDIVKRFFGYSYTFHLIMDNLFPEYWLKGSFQDFHEADIDNVTVSKKIVDSFVKLVVNQGNADLLFVALPASPDDDMMTSLRDGVQGGEIFAISEYMRDVAEKNKRIQFLDIQKAMMKEFPERDDRAKLFYPVDAEAGTNGHNNPHGTQFVATSISRRINTLGRLNNTEAIP